MDETAQAESTNWSQCTVTVPIRVETGLLAEWRQPSPETAVYRIYNADDELLYVGITNDLVIRWIGHRSDKVWWRREAHRYDVRWYPNRDLAAAQEKHAIMSERPKHNSLYRQPPLSPVQPKQPGAYSVKEIAQRFRFSPKTVREMAARADFPRQLTGLPSSAGRGARYSVPEVEEYFARRRAAGQ